MTTRRLMLVAAVAGLLAAACSGAASSTPEPSSVETVAPAALVVGGDRPVTVHVPASSDAARPAPLLIVLHGYSGSGEDVARYFGLAAAADQRGVVYAAPDGTLNSEDDRFWNATDACCDFDSSNVDDVAYLSGVIGDIQAEVAIDPKRIAVAGWSNGGFMSYRMACERAELVATVVSLAGATFADPGDCTPSEPVSVAQVHGTADDVVEFDGGVVFDGQNRPHPGAEATARAWAAYDGCEEMASAPSTRIDVDGNLTNRGDPAETSVEEWSGCDAGAAVQLWTIPKGSHFPALTPAFAESVIRFVVDHPKP